MFGTLCCYNVGNMGRPWVKISLSTHGTCLMGLDVTVQTQREDEKTIAQSLFTLLSKEAVVTIRQKDGPYPISIKLVFGIRISLTPI